MDKDNFKSLVKYEKWVVWLLGIDLFYRFFIGGFYYANIPALSVFRFMFIFVIAGRLFKLIDIANQKLNASWCKQTGWWKFGAIFFQYPIAPIFMYLVANHYKGTKEQKSTLQGYAITCTVLVIFIYVSLFLVLSNG